MDLSESICVTLWTNRVRCAFNKKTVNSLNQVPQVFKKVPIRCMTIAHAINKQWGNPCLMGVAWACV